MSSDLTFSNEMVSLNDMKLSDSTKILVNGMLKKSIFLINGDVHMENKSIGDMIGNSFGPNTNFQGNNVNQTNTEQPLALKKALDELKEEIESICDDAKRDDASMFYEMLIKYLGESKPSRVEKCLKKLGAIVGSTSSIITIASQLGVGL